MATEAAASPAAEAELSLLVKQVTHEAEGVVSVLLTDPDGRPLPPWRPGAHLEIVLPSGLIRQYSLCGDPGQSGAYQVAVLREGTGRGGSSEVHDTGLVGRVLRVRGPRNRFELVGAPAYVFIAGGIGITPLVPMVRAAAAKGVPWTLHYGGRTLRSMAFLDQLAAVAAAPAHASALHVVSEDSRGLLDLDRILSGADPRAAIYCCGPAGLIAAVQRQCEERGLTGRLHFERFGADPAAAVAQGSGTAGDAGVTDGADGAQAGTFEVELARTGLTVQVAHGESVLEAVRAVLPDVPSSCEEGICGTCEVKVLDGVPEHRDDILSESERAAGDTMFICVSRARSPRLVIDL